MIKDEGMYPSPKAMKFLEDYFTRIYQTRDKYFGNARKVRKVVLETIKQQNLRLAAIPLEERSPQMLSRITFEDVSTLVMEDDKPLYTRKGIGFGEK